jgi:hypothetical protein
VSHFFLLGYSLPFLRSIHPISVFIWIDSIQVKHSVCYFLLLCKSSPVSIDGCYCEKASCSFVDSQICLSFFFQCKFEPAFIYFSLILVASQIMMLFYFHFCNTMILIMYGRGVINCLSFCLGSSNWSAIHQLLPSNKQLPTD